LILLTLLTLHFLLLLLLLPYCCWNFVLEFSSFGLPMTDHPLGATTKILRGKRKSSLGPVFLFFFLVCPGLTTHKQPAGRTGAFVLSPRYANASSHARTQTNEIGSCSAYQWRGHGGGMSRFLSTSSSSSSSAG
jgi:hypothetical protein